ncbi:DUF2799 domain-containing protein [Endozoicomonas sp. SM1973]|uniref:DUF2799 domain-containing protein n=1 Tax=Spartinivicinus marinus TaxID=2994442 RepID=A0A853IE68_9GAMM|nr:DUF2799 domain-containing protein [Spartinivicinus marinus]MCX4028412.1 DUF2799 domain-containing protein [Spartinivicinus marinus]NYZ67475.1 DUF2799 domain-containing protein [Spartinivicinus marinus]
MKLVKKLVLITSIVQLTACSVMSREECLTADWYTVGYEDGADGQLSSRVGDYREACAEYGVTPTLEDYRLGRRSGLEKYCTEAKGYAEGIEGNSYKGVCPYESESLFLAGYRRGKEVYQAKKEWEDIRDDLRHAKSKLETLDEDIRKKERKLVKEGLTSAQRSAILQELNNIRDKKQQLQHRIYRLESDARWSKQQYNSLRYRSNW